MVNKCKVVLFGRVTGDIGKYSIIVETFIFNMFLIAWPELNSRINYLLKQLMHQKILNKCR